VDHVCSVSCHWCELLPYTAVSSAAQVTSEVVTSQDQVLMPPPPPSASKRSPQHPTACTATAADAEEEQRRRQQQQQLREEERQRQQQQEEEQRRQQQEQQQKQQQQQQKQPAKKPAKKIPEWAQTASLQETLRGPMMFVDPDEIFGPVATTCDLQSELLTNCTKQSCYDADRRVCVCSMSSEIFKSEKPRYTKRSSSGNWMPDHTTWQEEQAYKKAMGHKQGVAKIP
jgi:flagellar biosynthesis GTPase FlhF